MAIELALADHVHRLNAGNEDACAAKDLEPEHRPNDPFDRPMILLNYIVEVLALTQFDVAAMLGVVALDRRRVGTALVDGDLLRLAVQCHGLFQEAPRRSAIALGPEQKVDRVAFAIHRAVQILPLTVDFDVGLVHTPALAHRAFPSSE